MPELMRFPMPDGSTKVIDPGTGEVSFEDRPERSASPFGVPNPGSPLKTVQDVALPEPEPVNGIAEQAKTEQERVAALPKPDMTEQMAREAERGKNVPAYPDGSPELRSLLKLPFRERSQAMKLYQGALDAWSNMPALGTSLDTTDKLDRYFNALATFDDLLALVAISPDAYRSWQKSVDDQVFAELFFAYVTRFGLGEADSSSS